MEKKHGGNIIIKYMERPSAALPSMAQWLTTKELPHHPPWQGPPPPCPRWAGRLAQQPLDPTDMWSSWSVSTNMRVLPISSGNSFQQILWWNQLGNLQACIEILEWEIQKCKHQQSVAYPDSSVYIYLDNLHSSTQAHLINHFFRVARFRLRLGTCLVTKPGSMSFRNLFARIFLSKNLSKVSEMRWHCHTQIHFIHLWHVSFTSWFLTYQGGVYHMILSINKSPPKQKMFESSNFASIWC